MTQAHKEEQEVWEWVQGKHVPDLAIKTKLGKTALYYFQSGKCKSPSFHLIRSLQLVKEQEECTH